MHRDRFAPNPTSSIMATVSFLLLAFLIGAGVAGPSWMMWLTDVTLGWRIFAFAGSMLVLSGIVRGLLLMLPLLDNGYGRHALQPGGVS